MRCQFCGWDNPQGKETCEKCNKPLVGNASESPIPVVAVGYDNSSRPTDRQPKGEFNPKATVTEAINVNGSEPEKCPIDGFPLDDGVCRVCGYHVTKESETNPSKVVSEAKKTLRPKRKEEQDAKFKLVPISEETGLPEGEGLNYEGNEVVLNRDNTDPKNTTITSLEQACLTHENGKWSIEDKSEYKTTFVQAAHKIELHKDDLILLGNQLYRFEE